MLVLILAAWITNTGNAYMSGLAACKMFSVKDKKCPFVTMLCGALGTILTISGLADFLNTYISILGAVVPPIIDIVICDYRVICKGKAENWSPVRGINWVGIMAWIIGGGFALPLTKLALLRSKRYYKLTALPYLYCRCLLTIVS